MPMRQGGAADGYRRWFADPEFAAVLDINHAEVQQAALIAVAYPRREDFKPAYREPIQRFTHWASW